MILLHWSELPAAVLNLSWFLSVTGNLKSHAQIDTMLKLPQKSASSLIIVKTCKEYTHVDQTVLLNSCIGKLV